jgi:hypothetical protein
LESSISDEKRNGKELPAQHIIQLKGMEFSVNVHDVFNQLGRYLCESCPPVNYDIVCGIVNKVLPTLCRKKDPHNKTNFSFQWLNSGIRNYVNNPMNNCGVYNIMEGEKSVAVEYAPSWIDYDWFLLMPIAPLTLDTIHKMIEWVSHQPVTDQKYLLDKKQQKYKDTREIYDVGAIMCGWLKHYKAVEFLSTQFAIQLPLNTIPLTHCFPFAVHKEISHKYCPFYAARVVTPDPRFESLVPVVSTSSVADSNWMDLNFEELLDNVPTDTPTTTTTTTTTTPATVIDEKNDSIESVSVPHTHHGDDGEEPEPEPSFPFHKKRKMTFPHKKGENPKRK